MTTSQLTGDNAINRSRRSDHPCKPCIACTCCCTFKFEELAVAKVGQVLDIVGISSFCFVDPFDHAVNDLLCLIECGTVATACGLYCVNITLPKLSLFFPEARVWCIRIERTVAKVFDRQSRFLMFSLMSVVAVGQDSPTAPTVLPKRLLPWDFHASFFLIETSIFFIIEPSMS